MRGKNNISTGGGTCRGDRDRKGSRFGFGFRWSRSKLRAASDALTLSDVVPGTDCTIHRLYGHGPARQRLLDLGFQPGRTLRVLRNAPLNDPIEVQLGDTFIALRRQEAEHVEVAPPSDTQQKQGDTDD